MGRLIDADALKKYYTNAFVEKYGIKCAEMLRSIIDQMPTAYDPEVVVAELEERIKENTNNDMSYKIPYFGLEIALNIVNRVAEEYSVSSKNVHTVGWISCRERLPETKEVVVADVTYMCSEIVWVSLENELMMHAYLENGRWYSIGGELIKEKVVAWHPAYKPARYKADKASK